MKIKKFLKKEKTLFHKHFIPALFAGLIVGIVSYFFQITLSNVILFASVGSSAMILTNSKSHHLTKLRTAVDAYLITMTLAILVYLLNKVVPLHLSFNIFLLVFLTGIFLFLLNSFHPPAIAASISFVLSKTSLMNIFYFFLILIVSLVFVRLMAYTFSQDLSVKDFFSEFKRMF